MKCVVFSTKPHDRDWLERANRGRHELAWVERALDVSTAPLAAGAAAVCAFVGDRLDHPCLAALAAGGTRLVLLRSAGYDHVDLGAASALGIAVTRVPGYSPSAVAEHAVALMLSLNRAIHRAWPRVRANDFSLDGLLGFDLHGKTVGLVGTGRIGLATSRILAGFGCRLIAHDPRPDPAFSQLGGRYVDLPELWAASDVVSLHCPLVPGTRHLVDDAAIAAMRPGVMLINTSRGGIIDTRAAIAGLKAGRIGWLGLDVYEEEAALFFEDRSGEILQDDVFARLIAFPNVLVTGHQGFFTREALAAIATTTLDNLDAFARGLPCPDALHAPDTG
jgi:D-lactate dehydrogenase